MSLPTSGPPAKGHSNGLSLTGRQWSASYADLNTDRGAFLAYMFVVTFTDVVCTLTYSEFSDA